MSSTDKDATLMMMKEGHIASGYNAQFATEHQVILGYGLTSDRNDFKQLKPAIKEVAANTGKKPETAAVDASSAKELDELFGTLEKNHDRLDFLICNMMAKPEGYYRPFPEYSLEIWNRVLEVNLTGVFLACQRASRLMKKRKNGSIVLTSSVYGLVSPDFRIYRHCSPQKNPYGGSEPLTAPVAYTASKGGIAALTRYLAVFLGPDGIRVNTLTPGGVYDGHEEEFHKAYVKKTPIGRMAVWSDYNGAALFLVSDASRYMTGANLVIDGGWTAW